MLTTTGLSSAMASRARLRTSSFIMEAPFLSPCVRGSPEPAPHAGANGEHIDEARSRAATAPSRPAGEVPAPLARACARSPAQKPVTATEAGHGARPRSPATEPGHGHGNRSRNPVTEACLTPAPRRREATRRVGVAQQPQVRMGAELFGGDLPAVAESIEEGVVELAEVV